MHLSQRLLIALTAAASFLLVSGDALAVPNPGGDGGFGGDLCTAWFISPLPNELFEGAPVTIDAEIGVYQGLDDGPITTVEVFVNEVSIGVQDCPDGCTFADIVLDQGVHSLSLLASTGYATGVTVYVDEEVPSGTGGETGTDDGGTDDGGTSETGTTDGGSGGGGGGCSVQATPPAPWALLALPLFLLVPAFRRQR